MIHLVDQSRSIRNYKATALNLDRPRQTRQGVESALLQEQAGQLFYREGRVLTGGGRRCRANLG